MQADLMLSACCGSCSHTPVQHAEGMPAGTYILLNSGYGLAGIRADSHDMLTDC